MKVWVPGGSGMLGQAVRRTLQASGVPHLATGREVDITDHHAVAAFVAQHAPQVVINCAAFTAVDAAETQLAQAEAINGDGPGVLAAAVGERGGTLVHVSTDYVFDGKAQVPYGEEAPCAPLGAYGRSKHRGEQAVLKEDKGERHIIVRTSWLFGHGGGNFVATMLRVMGSRQEVAVVADQQGRPCFTADLAAALVRLGGVTQQAAPPGVYHFANSGAVSWHAFAQGILTAARRRGMPLSCKTVRAITTRDYPTPAERPAFSVLRTDKVAAILGPPRHWTAALEAYLDEQPSAGKPS